MIRGLGRMTSTLVFFLRSGWNSQNDSGSGNLKAAVSSLSYPVASEGPPPALRAKSGSSCELT